MTDTSLITFKAISNFTKDLGDMFSSNQHSLKLYCHLINKTTLSHDKAIKKHIDAFRDFCIENRDHIASKNYSKFTKTSIIYSTNVFIDLDAIFKLADKETQQVIWKHVLVISALVDPAGKAKEILKQTATGKEGDFLTDIISKVEQHVDPNSNPMEAVSNIMKSGVFTDIISSMQDGMGNGSLDLGKLMNSVQTMVTTLNGQTGGENSESMNALNTMMGSLATNGPSGVEGQPMPDLSSLMSMMGPMLSTLGNANGAAATPGGMPDIGSMMSALSGNEKSIEEKIEEQVIAAKVNKKSKKKKSKVVEELD
jgi:hypothetical protein